ncbi:hypothetical protein SG34_026710 [Thalassomonas viridans]|uniref:Uncharacterized protein n=1 Tax=Thalassomonas viridans TaxID=137584 RepID=A0AAF0C8X8_9GAMM|nr:hypothetical protein [Thalassomonas viridans]WDE04861.1 hypothetical protein SG34_026710 [Thalassomonas viridans]
MHVTSQNLGIVSDGSYEQFKGVTETSGIKGKVILLNDRDEFVVISNYEKPGRSSKIAKYNQEYDSNLKAIGISAGLGGLKAATAKTADSLRTAMETRFQVQEDLEAATDSLPTTAKVRNLTTGAIKGYMRMGEHSELDRLEKIEQQRLEKTKFADFRRQDAENAKLVKEMQAGIKLDSGTYVLMSNGIPQPMDTDMVTPSMNEESQQHLKQTLTHRYGSFIADLAMKEAFTEPTEDVTGDKIQHAAITAKALTKELLSDNSSTLRQEFLQAQDKDKWPTYIAHERCEVLPKKSSFTYDLKNMAIAEQRSNIFLSGKDSSTQESLPAPHTRYAGTTGLGPCIGWIMQSQDGAVSTAHFDGANTRQTTKQYNNPFETCSQLAKNMDPQLGEHDHGDSSGVRSVITWGGGRNENPTSGLNVWAMAEVSHEMGVEPEIYKTNDLSSAIDRETGELFSFPQMGIVDPELVDEHAKTLLSGMELHRTRTIPSESVMHSRLHSIHSTPLSHEYPIYQQKGDDIPLHYLRADINPQWIASSDEADTSEEDSMYAPKIDVINGFNFQDYRNIRDAAGVFREVAQENSKLTDEVLDVLKTRSEDSFHDFEYVKSAVMLRLTGKDSDSQALKQTMTEFFSKPFINEGNFRDAIESLVLEARI